LGRSGGVLYRYREAAKHREKDFGDRSADCLADSKHSRARRSACGIQHSCLLQYGDVPPAPSSGPQCAGHERLRREIAGRRFFNAGLRSEPRSGTGTRAVHADSSNNDISRNGEAIRCHFVVFFLSYRCESSLHPSSSNSSELTKASSIK